MVVLTLVGFGGGMVVIGTVVVLGQGATVVRVMVEVFVTGMVIVEELLV